MQFDEHGVEVEISRRLAHHIVKVAQTMQDPAFKFRQFVINNFFRIIKAGKVPQQEAQGVAQTTIDVGMALNDFVTDAQIIMIVGTDDPQTQDVGTKLVDDVVWRNHVSQRLGHLAAFAIQNKAVGQDCFIRRATAGSA